LLLSAGVLTAAEREEALSAVPELMTLQLNWSRAWNLGRDGMLAQLDAMVAGYVREAIGAYIDGSFLLVRVAGHLAESRAAELFCDRVEPTPWLTVPEGLADEKGQSAKLRVSLAQMPLEAAALYLDAAMHHLTNAVVRMSWEAGFPAADFKRLRFNASARFTDDRGWTQWSLITREFHALESEGNILGRFSLAKALVGCSGDPDFRAAIEYRHRLVHRGVPVDLWTVAIERATGYTKGPISITLPITAGPDEPQIAASRDAIARALGPARRIQDAVQEFLPKWAAHVGFLLEFEDTGVHFKADANPSRIHLPARHVFLPTRGTVRIIEQRAGHVEFLSREQRDPSLFLD
jgi:hypothetical protein